jgi:ketosteroid isomerase-like protein
MFLALTGCTRERDHSRDRDRNREVVRAFFSRLEAFDIESFAGLFATDGVQIMPFSPEGFPSRLEGRAAIYNQYRSMPQSFASMKFPDLQILDAADPSTFVVTYRGEIELRRGGRYDNTYLGVFVIRDGHIATFTEYFNPIVLQRAFGANLGSDFNVTK